jgi:putative sigma-54 modulation protein
MTWQLKSGTTRIPADLPRYIERKLKRSLDRLGDRITKVVVFLRDVNGPRGGVDKACRVLVKARGCIAAVALVVDPNWYAAVDRATSRVGLIVSREVDKRRTDSRARQRKSAKVAARSRRVVAHLPASLPFAS